MARDHPSAAQHRKSQQLSHMEHSHVRPLPRGWPIRTMAGHDLGPTRTLPERGRQPYVSPVLACCPEPPRGLRRDRALACPSDVDALSVVYVGQTAALLATRSGTLVPVTAGPTGLVPGGLGVPDRAALAPILAGWFALSDRSGHDAPDQSAGGHRAEAIDLRAWHAAATAVELRITARPAPA